MMFGPPALPPAMTAALLLALPLSVAAEEARPLSRAEFRDRLAGFAKVCNAPGRPDPAAVVPGGVRLYHAAGEVRNVSGAEAGRARRMVLGKLLPVRDRLIRRGLKWEKDRAALAAGRVPRRRRPGESFAGPREQRNARRLIDLIQSVVAPDTWDVNGGPSTIRYYDLYQALVVRAPQSAHDDFGAALRGLRK